MKDKMLLNFFPCIQNILLQTLPLPWRWKVAVLHSASWHCSTGPRLHALAGATAAEPLRHARLPACPSPPASVPHGPKWIPSVQCSTSICSNYSKGKLLNAETGCFLWLCEWIINKFKTLLSLHSCTMKLKCNSSQWYKETITTKIKDRPTTHHVKNCCK